MPKRLCVNPGVICPKRPGGRSGRGNSQDTSDVCAWPVAVPTHIFSAALFTFDTGAPGVKYHPLAPESTIAVSFLASLVAIGMANLRIHFRAILLLLSFLSAGTCQELCGNLPNICDKDCKVLFTKDSVSIYDSNDQPFLKGWRETSGAKLWRISLRPDVTPDLAKCTPTYEGTTDDSQEEQATLEALLSL